MEKEFADFLKQTAEEQPLSLAAIARSYSLEAQEFDKQYKNHLSGFTTWDQKEHADKWLLFEKILERN